MRGPEPGGEGTLAAGDGAGGTPRQEPLVRVVGALGVANLLAQGAPLLVVPYLARVLGAAGWGPVLVAQALAAWVVLLLDYASDLHGARAVAAAPPHAQGAALWGVQRAKLLLVAPALLLLAAACLAVPALRADPLLTAWTAVAAVARGLSPLWGWVALERAQGAGLRQALLVDTGTRVAAALGVLLVVHAPTHGWRVLALQGTLAAAASAWLWWRLRGVVPPPAGSRHNWWTSAWHSLRGGRALFAFRALGTVYQHGALLLLGVLAPAGAVAAYGAADRLVRAGLNLLEPVSRAVVPRVARLQVAGGGAWEGMVRMLLVWLGGGALLCCFVLFLGAELVVRVVLGDGYQAAVPVLRVLAIMLPLVAVATVLGFFWALPAGRDGVLLRGTALAGAVNLALVAGLVPRYEAIGMGVAVVAAEGVMVGVLARAYRGRG